MTEFNSTDYGDGKACELRELRYEGNRAYGNQVKLCKRMWGNVGFQFVPEDDPTYVSWLWDGENYMRYSGASRQDPGRVRPYMSGRGEIENKALSSTMHGSALRGYFGGTEERIDAVLRKARKVSVRGRTEPVDGAECYVIDANTKHGQYTIWINPEHGYNIARARLIQLREDKYHVLGPRQPQAATIKLTCSLDNVRFEMIDDLWLAMEADIRSHRIFDAKGTFSRSRSHVRLTEVILNPDHEALGSFVPNDIRDGAKIIAFVDLNDGILTAWDPEYRWSSDAKFVVNRKGNWVRYEPDKGMLPVVKALPDLRELELRIEPRQAKDKKVLLCFCDMRQSASKRHVLELRERAASLADKGVILALLQFSAGSTDEVEAWMRKNEIHLPVGIIQDRVKQVLRAWRVQELPWLVLTGRDHVVTAEGFGLNELNGKIEAAN